MAPSSLPGHLPLDLLTPPQSPTGTQLKVNCVLVGDQKIGKSAIVKAYVTPGARFRCGYDPTTSDEYIVEKHVDDGFGHQTSVLLNIVDTGGQKDLDRLRPLCYNDANVFILCFSVVVPASFQSLITKWLPEIRRHTDPAKVSLFLVGTQSDLRSNTTVLLKLSANNKCPVSESRAIRLGGKIGARNYIECSALTQRNVRQLFDYILLNNLRHDRRSVEDTDDTGTRRPIGIQRTLSFDKEHRNVGKKGRQLIRTMLSKQWNTRKSYKMKRLLLFSCLFN